MFTIEQVKAAHSKVKSGADFPQYIQDLTALGVQRYEIFVADGHGIYYGTENDSVQSEAKYPVLDIATTANLEQFIHLLKLHQKGGTDYMTFCNDAARSGVEKWVVRMDAMSCVYFDKAGNEMLMEEIPAK
ncbi:MAG: DUF1398 domain-containing protein [Chitinophagaceae bacterium]|nr:DUF1398 domain-containing protein [Chitinophagaceae bacterium]